MWDKSLITLFQNKTHNPLREILALLKHQFETQILIVIAQLFQMDGGDDLPAQNSELLSAVSSQDKSMGASDYV